jgi:hypothetical protein
VAPVALEKDPGGHRVQNASADRFAPAAPYDPVVQGDPLHAEAPAAEEKDPAGQGEQTASTDRFAPAGPYDPGEHGDPMHDEAPSSTEKDPEAHGEHAWPPVRLEYDPRPQSVHAEAPVTAEKDPAGHVEQTASDARFAPAMPDDPEEQDTPLHAEAPDPV